MFEDFSDMPGYKGTVVNTSEKLFDMISNADRHELQIFIHAIGDYGIHEVLNIFEKVEKQNGKRDRRWRIEHSQHIKPSDIPRFKQLGVTASVQPYHAIDDGRFVAKMLGNERLKGTYAFRSLLDSGATVAFGSDWFVAPPVPILTIHAAVNRILENGVVFMPEECVTIEEALRCSTYFPAWSVFQENEKGLIKKGFLGDIVVLDQNLLKCDKKKFKTRMFCLQSLEAKLLTKIKNLLRKVK